MALEPFKKLPPIRTMVSYVLGFKQFLPLFGFEEIKSAFETLIEAGQEAFLKWLRQPVSSLRAFRVELIAKLRFFNLLAMPGAAELIDQQFACLQHMLDEWQQPPAGENSPDLFPDLVDDFRRRQAAFLVEWLAAWRDQFQDTSVH